MSKGGGKVQFVQNDAPNFIKKFKERAGIKEDDTDINSKVSFFNIILILILTLRWSKNTQSDI